MHTRRREYRNESEVSYFELVEAARLREGPDSGSLSRLRMNPPMKFRTLTAKSADADAG